MSVDISMPNFLRGGDGIPIFLLPTRQDHEPRQEAEGKYYRSGVMVGLIGSIIERLKVMI